MLIEVDFDFLVEHKMTIEQYMLCYVLEQDKKAIKLGERKPRKDGPPIAIIYKYTENVKPINPDEMQDLIDRGYLIKKGKKNIPDLLEVTPKFKQEIFNHWTNFQQLFDIYPDRISFGPGKPSASLKSLDISKEEMADYYSKVVRTNKKHREVLQIVKWAKEKDLLRVGIQKFIYSEGWHILKHQYQSGGVDAVSDRGTLL